MGPDDDGYGHALRYRWLTSLYDPLMRLTMREARFKADILSQADIRPGDRVLDLACGTGTLAIRAKLLHPRADVSGLDGDPTVLDDARRKARVAGITLAFDEGLSFEMPYADASFDRVLTTLFFHHLTTDEKVRTLGEILRVLRPGGELHVADWGEAPNALMYAAFLLVRLLDGFERTADSVQGRLQSMMEGCGFERVTETGRLPTVFGSLSYYSAIKPGAKRFSSS